MAVSVRRGLVLLLAAMSITSCAGGTHVSEANRTTAPSPAAVAARFTAAIIAGETKTAESLLAPDPLMPDDYVRTLVSYAPWLKTSLGRPAVVSTLHVEIPYTAVGSPRPHWRESQTGTFKISLVLIHGTPRVERFDPILADDLMSWNR